MKNTMHANCGIAMLVMVLMSAVAAQQEPTSSSCINKLVPCLNYLNGTARDPPDSCCDPLKSVIKSEPECLCRMISNKGSKQAEEAGIDVNEAQQLPARCGQHVNPISCLTNSGRSSNSNKSTENSAFRKGSMVFMVTTLSIFVQVLWMLFTSI